jgi:hypothetical protein
MRKVKGYDKDIEFHVSGDYSKELGQMDYLTLLAVYVIYPLLNKIKDRDYSKKTCVLFAHGSSNSKGEWIYTDPKIFINKNNRVQKWINKYDGRFKNLILFCCNPDAKDIKSKHSVVFAPNDSISIDDCFKASLGEKSIDQLFRIYEPTN